MVKGTEATIYTDGNSNNRLAGGGFAVNSHVKNQSWRVIGGYKKAGDANAPAYNLSNTGYENFSFQTGIKVGSSNNYLEFNYSIYQSKNAMLRASHFGNITDLTNAINSDVPLYIEPFTYKIAKPYQKAMHQLLSAKWSKTMKKGRRLSIQLATQYNLRHEYDLDKVYNPALSKLNLAAFSLGILTTSLESKWEIPLTSTIKLNTGLSYIFQYNNAWGKRYLIPNFQSHLIGLYAVSKYKSKSYSAELGIRADARQIKSDAVRNFISLNEKRNYQGITSIFSVSKEFFKCIDISLITSTGWRAPNVSELYSNGLHGATGNFEIGNQGLETEKSWNNEITIKLHKKKLHMETNIYANQIANFIYMQPDKVPTLTIQGAFPTMRYMSANVLMKGVESKWILQQKQWQFEISGMYLSTLNKVTKEALWMIPSNRLRTEISYTPKDRKILTSNRMEISYSYVFKQMNLPQNIDYASAPNAYCLVLFKYESTLIFRNQPIKLNITINNILNKSYRDYLYRYRYYANEQGRDIQLHIQIPINNFSKHFHNN
ncbi:MAG: TonB-dependent receptor [Bacteroidetes bacterium]|nr:TonB-dependent receptor [Bacteroidota bacterium]